MSSQTKNSRKAHCRNCRVTAWLLFLAIATIALAQLPTATIMGTVKDSTGAVVPDGAVTVRNRDTGLTRTDRSRADGSYRFVALPVGVYEVRAEQAGFRSEVRSGVTLAVGQEAVVNFALQVGAIEQTVEVTGEAPLVNTTSGTLGTLVNEQQVSDLPLNGRNYVNLTLLQPGVVVHVSRDPSTSGPGTWFSANGAPLRSNFYMLDGAPMGNSKGASTASAGANTLGIEGIREWRLVTNSSSAEYGMRMGAQMTIVSKGGTNSFHGSLFEYLRNSALDARNFFDYKTETRPWRLPPFRRNQFGGSAGGPIKTDKLFYFATYEGLRERLGLTQVNDVIPPSAKVDGGLVPQINPVIKPLLALFPDPNLPRNRFTFPSTKIVNEHYGQVRGDYLFSTNDTVFARYTVDSGTEILPLAYPQFKRFRDNRMHFLTVSETHTFSPVLLGTFRFSWSRPWLAIESPSGLIGPQYSFVPGRELGAISIGGVTRLSADTASPGGNKLNVLTWSGDLYYTKGRHSLKFGTLANHYRPQLTVASVNHRGSINFANIEAFLLGRTNSYTSKTPGSIPGWAYNFRTLGFYVQDDVRALSNLTLNLGLRYEFNTDYTEVDGRESALRDIRRDAAFTVGPTFQNPSLKNISPRFGFAWDVQGDGRTSVRGGFGLMYDIATFNDPLSNVLNAVPPFASSSTVPTPTTLTSFPLVFPPEAVGKSVRTMDYRIQNPHMLHYNFTVERQLPFNMAFSLAYAGSRGLNLIGARAANPPIPQVLPDGRFFWLGNEPRPNPNWDEIQYTPAALNSWYNSMQFVVNKLLSQGLQFQSSYTWAKLIDERTGIAGEDGGGSNNPIATSLLPRRLDRGLAEYTLAHSWRFNAIYRLPAMPLQGFLGKVLNGWWISGILTAQTGLPLSLNLTSDRSRSRGAGNVPDLKLGRKNDNITKGASTGCLGVPAGQKLGGVDRYFDPCAFSIPAIGTLGNMGRNILIARGVANLDFSLVKDTALGFLGESGKLEFRAEIFNILNRVNFSRPNNGVYAARADIEAPLPAAGQISSTDLTSRQIQLALKVIW